jgi:hypothetical protein
MYMSTTYEGVPVGASWRMVLDTSPSFDLVSGALDELSRPPDHFAGPSTRRDDHAVVGFILGVEQSEKRGGELGTIGNR